MEERFDNLDEKATEDTNDTVEENETVNKAEKTEEEITAQEESAECPAVDPVKSKKKKKLAILISSLVAGVLVIAAAITAFLYFNNPKVLAKNSIKGLITGLADRQEFAIFDDIVDGGSVEVNYEGRDKSNKLLSSGGKMYFAKDAVLLDGLNLKLDDKTVDVGLYLGEDYSYIESKCLFGDDAYGIIKGKMLEAFESSMFVYGTDGDYAVKDMDVSNAMQELCWAYDKEQVDELVKDIEKIAVRYTKVLEDAVEKYADYDIEHKKITVFDEKISARVIVIEVEENEMRDIMEYVLEKLENDKKVRELIEKHAEIFEKTLIAYDVIEKSHEEAIEVFEKKLEEWKKAAKKYKCEDMELKLYMSYLSPKLYRAVYTEGDSVEVIDIGKGGVKKAQELSYTDNHETYTYEIKKNNSSVYDANLTLNEEGKDKELFSIKIDWEDEEIELKFGDDETYSEYNGTIVEEDGTYTLTFTELEKDGVVSKKFVKLEIIFNKNDKLPEVREKEEIKNALSIKDEDIEKIKENIKDLLT